MHTINLKLLLFLIPIILKAGTINESLIEYVCIDPSAENYFALLDPESPNWDDSYFNPNSANYSDFIAQNYEVDNSSCIYEATSTCQNIHLNEGWNMISTYIAYTYPILDAEGFYETVVANLIISKSNSGQAYLPPWLIIPHDVNNMEGYLVKMSDADTLIHCGNQIMPETYPITLYEGWNIMPYLRDTPQDAVEAFDEIIEEIIIVKDSYGTAYMPNWNYNGRGFRTRTRI
jgi:hypothetical protein